MQLQEHFIAQLANVEVQQTVPFNKLTARIMELDLTAANDQLTKEIVADRQRFTNWIAHTLAANNAQFAIGGYNEDRTIYSRSEHFDTGGEEPRRLHLGTDIWGPAGTPVAAFANATVHGFGNNPTHGDYGATIILKYKLGTLAFYVLYGHLNLASLNNLEIGMVISAGKKFAEFGPWDENGNWPPHLHFQLILDIAEGQSDYPGVCKFSERAQWLANSPDPMLILSNNFS